MAGEELESSLTPRPSQLLYKLPFQVNQIEEFDSDMVTGLTPGSEGMSAGNHGTDE